MANLKDIIFFLVTNYPNKDHLSNARITKMVYLTDWYSVNVFHTQVSCIRWYFNNYGPFVNDILEAAKQSPDIFEIKTIENFYGAPKRIISTKSTYSPQLSEEQILSLKRVIEISKDKTWDQFITFVYSTYPIAVSERFTELDLVSLAVEYQKKQKEL